MHQNKANRKHPTEKDKNEGPLDIAEKGSKIGSAWFDELIKKDFPSKKNDDKIDEKK